MKPDLQYEMMGRSPPFQAVLRAARLVAVTGATVLIQGESGVGKELLARVIHDTSPRAKGPFVPVNCAALTESLVESELFGHLKGAFTGAATDRMGRIAAAQGGTLFLDEIGDMPMAIQAKILRFLENGECQPVGCEMPRRVDARVVAATNRDLASLVAANRFRQDLFYRLQVVPLVLPPLRERGQDVELLAHAFVDAFAQRHGVRAPQFSREAQELMRHYTWPGNIRELRNLCERAVIFHAGQVLEASFVQGHLIRQPTSVPNKLPEQSALGSADTPALALPTGGISLDTLERDMILAALDRTQGNRTHAARLLDISRDTLLYRMKKHALR
ncbi:MAG: sigma-54-dependent Fis family transcriptional regulator [Magnetococcales bacterium]|nr:sigma-54-dependent Fis family transcriptional regulator [Magnetococcales bacterium]NGZ06913.1 sigma-54-dependent Fis family transcriptional regulator [Magnetococcales bacterium]